MATRHWSLVTRYLSFVFFAFRFFCWKLDVESSMLDVHSFLSSIRHSSFVDRQSKGLSQSWVTSGLSAIWNVAGHVNKFTFFLAGWTLIRWSLFLKGITALLTFPFRHHFLLRYAVTAVRDLSLNLRSCQLAVYRFAVQVPDPA